MDAKDLYYEKRKDIITDSIYDLVLSNELKEGLYKVNEQIYNYALKLNKNKIKSKVSFFFCLDNLRFNEKRKIINCIRKMFNDYDLSLGKSKKLDVKEENPMEYYDKISEADFWEIDFSKYHNPTFFNHYYPGLKICCRDLIKCFFIITCGNYLSEVEKEIEDKSNTYLNCKYDFDFLFRITRKTDIYKEMKEHLTFEGYQCEFDSNDISSVDEYRDNEIFIESALIKKNILKDDNKISFKDVLQKNNIKNDLICLDDMIGLSNVKDELKNLEYLLKFYKDIGQKNNIFLSLVFKGNPGTGKTTVARNYAEILYNLGYTKSNKLIETVPNDFMGGYVGQTKWQTEEILEKAKGGVLFIDEAYNLMEAKEGSGGSYMREVVVSLLKYMEDRSNVVIFAGYKNEMDELIENINPGFKSRIGKVLDFEDYSSAELISIFKLYSSKKGLKCSKSFENKLKSHIEKAKTMKNFGNARYMENILNEILYVHAKNVYENKANIYELTENDFKLKEKNNQNFGFVISKESD